MIANAELAWSDVDSGWERGGRNARIGDPRTNSRYRVGDHGSNRTTLAPSRRGQGSVFRVGHHTLGLACKLEASPSVSTNPSLSVSTNPSLSVSTNPVWARQSLLF